MLMNFYHFGCSILSFLFVVPKETSSSSDFRISNSSLDDYFLFICGLEAATTKRAQTLNMFKLSTAIQVLQGQIQYIWCSKGHRRDGFWVKGLMCWLVQVAKSFLKTSFFDLSLVSIANVLKRGSYHKKKGFDKGFSTTGSSLIRPGNALFWPAIKKDVFFLVGWGEVYLKYPSIWS